MKKYFLLLVVLLSTTSCLTNKTYIQDYSQKVRLLKTTFPELYQLYCNGSIIIDDVYTYDKDGTERVGINYHYR